MAAQRVKRLKDMVDLLERLPASSDRDRMLSEVRSRMVDVDTGVTPRAMLPVREPAPVQARPPRPAGASTVTRTAPAVEPTLPAPAVAVATEVRMPERLSLEDASLPHDRAHGAGAAPPWTLGLRG